MRASKTILMNGTLKETEIKGIRQSSLTSDCWIVQVWGLEKCQTCKVQNTEECGGGAALEKMLVGPHE